MDNEKEISFGAFDSELMRQEIFIPEGFEATIDGDKIILTRKDSEDERIRKELIGYIVKEVGLYPGEDRKEHKWLRWLEKQGEQKPIDKIQLGKKYKCIASPRYSTFRRGNIYKPVDNFLCNLMNLCYECFEPIEDSEQKPTDEDMKEALRTEYEKGRADAFAQMQKEWSEEDEKIRQNLMSLLSDMRRHRIEESTYQKYYPWLKSLKDKVIPQSKQEWSEEDEVKINRIVACLENLNVADNDILLKDVDWLKSLKERYTWKPKTWEIQILESVIEKGENPKNYSATLHSILEQLKKLKGE